MKLLKELFKIIAKRPSLYEQSEKNIWNDEYVAKNMLRAHLDQNLDSATRKIEFVKRSVNWIADMLPPAEYPQLLDLGCGTGIYAELFCEKGYDVTGIDLSGGSIAYAKDSAFRNELSINYLRGDYTGIDFGSRYNLITLIYCDFGVLPALTRKKLLCKIYDSLQPGGVFLFDVFTPVRYAGVEEIKQWSVEEKGFWKEELCLTLQALYCYEEKRTFLNQYVTVTRDEVSCYNVWEHTFTMEELEDDLREAGFGEMRVFGDVAGKEYEREGDTICLVVRK